jgi:hypothetical protein
MKFSAKILIIIFAGFITINSAFAFGDIPSEDVNYHIFQHLNDVGIMNSYNDGNFYPEKFVTRAEAVIITLRAGGIIIPANFDSSKLPFTDVNPNEWYAPAIARASELGIINTNFNTFAPNAAVSKAEFLSFLFSATNVNLKKYSSRIKNIANGIPFDSWFAPVFSYAKQFQIAYLPATNLYFPNKALTRREVAVMTYRQLRIFYGDETIKDFIELQAKVQQFILLLRAGESERAEFQLQRILNLSQNLTLRKNDKDAVAAAAITRAIRYLAESLRSFKQQKNLKALESLFLAIQQTSRAKEKSESLNDFAEDLENLIEETLYNFTRPKSEIFLENFRY